MPFTTLVSDGLSVACFLGEHNWEKGLEVSHFFPADVTAGLSGREGRRPEAEEQLLAAKLLVLAEEEEAQALRQRFATLGKGWVGIPHFADQFLGADAETHGARIYAAQRLIDLTVPEIVAGDAELDPAHVYAPLIVGHIVELPEIQPANDGLAICSPTLTEDSPWHFRIAILGTTETAEFPPIEADWQSPPVETPVHGLEFARIGFQREQTIAQEERAFVWTSEAGFSLEGKLEIASLLRFFTACRGPWNSFTCPAWFTPGEATAEAPHATKVRFADRTLKLRFTTPGLASARVKFVQVPWEIAGVVGETPQQPPRIFLYQFTYDVPGPVVWRYTNCWRPLTREGDGTYQPGPFLHDAIAGGLTLADEGLVLNSFLFEGSPFALYNPNVLEGRLWLRIYEVETWPIDPDAAELKWFGSIPKAPQDGRKIAAECAFLGGLLEREVPGVRVGPLCNTFFFSSRCGHSKAAFAKAGTLTSKDGAVVVIATADAAAANTYAPGKIELGSGLGYEARSIVSSLPVVGGQQLTLDRSLRQAAEGQAVTYYRSCDRAKATCQALDPSGWKDRFRGHPNLPQVNLSLPQGTVAPAGGKK